MLQAFQSNICQSLFAKLAQAIPQFARDSHFVQRVSKKFCPRAFLLALLNAVSSGKGSLQQIAIQLSLLSDTIPTSPQALHERLHRTAIGAESFLVRCLALINSQQYSHSIASTRPCPFARILIEDSSQLALHAHNTDEFPGHGNHLGSTAGCKIDICFDLLTGQPLLNQLHLATTQDKTIAFDLLDHLQPNDLVLRDMGYFIIETFLFIEQQNAYWLSRLPRGVHVENSEGIALETILQHTTADTLDTQLLLGKVSKHPVRLVAKRCTKTESQKNRRELRVRYASRGETPTQTQLTRCDWHIMVTNVSSKKQTSHELYEVYRQRWQIELAFRGWKKSHSLKVLGQHRTSSTHLKVLLLAAMILLSLSLRLMKEAQKAMTVELRSRLSMEKVMEYLSQAMVKLKSLTEIIKQTPDQRHLCTQKRARKSLIYQQYTSLA